MKTQSYQTPQTEQVNFYGACPRMMQSADPSQANDQTLAPRRASEINKIP